MSENTQAKLGKLIDGEEHRDAVHIAVAPVVAAKRLSPGQHVGLDAEGCAGGQAEPPIGVVDPFLPEVVLKGETFWLFLYPNTITSLRHEWVHPSFAPAVPAAVKPSEAESEAWLRRFCETADCPGYDVVMAAALGEHEKNGASADDPDPDGLRGYYHSENDGEYLHFGGRDAHGDIPDEFWHHVEVVSGKTIPRARRARYFSCSC
jgi:hypothetical protein